MSILYGIDLFQSTPSVGRATTSRRPRATTISRFQSTPSVGRATVTGETDSDLVIDFNPRPPWGGRRYRRKISCLNCHFNPRPPWGGRPAQGGRKFKSCKFQSTPSVGRATRPNLFRLQYRRNFNPRPPWGGRPKVVKTVYDTIAISIHALRGEGDNLCDTVKIYHKISIHALRGEGDYKKRLEELKNTLFQSTPSVGRATAKIYKYAMLCLYIVHIKLYIFATAVLFI